MAQGLASSEMLRASCDRCHRDKVKCQFEPGASVCVRCRHRNGRRCVRSPPMPPGRSKAGGHGAKGNPTAVSHQTSHQLPRDEMEAAAAAGHGFIPEGPSHSAATHMPNARLHEDPSSATATGSPILPGLDTRAGSGLAGTSPFWWGSAPASAFEPHLHLPLWHLGNDYSPISFGATGTEPSLSSGESSTTGGLLRIPSEGSSPGTDLTADHTSAMPRCHCSGSLARFLENESHPCLSSDPLVFDVVLDANRAVIRAVRGLAECPGWAAHPPGLAMAACMLVQSVLASLHEAWWLSCRGPPAGHAGNMNAATACPTVQHMQRGGRGAGAAGAAGQQVFIGSYRMDEEDGAVLRRQMILLDLDKVRRTMGLLQEQMDRGPVVEGVQSFAGRFLAAEVQRIMNRISEHGNTS